MPLSLEAQMLAAIIVATVALWVTEALPLPVTALAAVVACVVAGVAPAKEVFRPFAEPLVFLFIGSFMLAEAIRVHRLDRRLAFTVLAVPWVGEVPGRILAAVAVVSATISAFISNTATTAMMVAIALGILSAVEDASRDQAAPDGSPARPLNPRFATGLLLAVAFSASIGGLATPIGTPPNLIGLAFIRQTLGIEVSFFGWCALGVPIAAGLTVATVALLTWLFPAGVERLPGVAQLVARERRLQGGWSTGQRSTALAFGLTVSLWTLPGVLSLLLGQGHPAVAWLGTHLPEGVAALIGAILLFVLPGGPGRRALEWREAAGIDWGIILLYGGGMALGELAFSTGLAGAVGQGLTGWLPAGSAGGAALVVAATVVAVVTSEFTSNTASANMVVPVVIALAEATGGNPLPAALAATFASSLGFMMPVSTPCNAIAYGTGRIPLRAMMSSGILLDLLGAIVIAAAMLAFAG
ncbi:MAG: DASS family sodium-coupled anion symporter [Planctomycetota bacterium]